MPGETRGGDSQEARAFAAAERSLPRLEEEVGENQVCRRGEMQPGRSGVTESYTDFIHRKRK